MGGKVAQTHDAHFAVLGHGNDVLDSDGGRLLYRIPAQNPAGRKIRCFLENHFIARNRIMAGLCVIRPRLIPPQKQPARPYAGCFKETQ